jgi:hypothetical protein
MIQVNKVIRNTYNTTYRDNVLDLEVRVETNPTNIQVSTPTDTQYITPEQVQAQYNFYKELNNLVQSVNSGKTPRLKSPKTEVVTELVNQ